MAGGQQEVSEDREGREDHHPRLVALPRDFIYIVYNTIGASAQLETAPAVDVARAVAVADVGGSIDASQRRKRQEEAKTMMLVRTTTTMNVKVVPKRHASRQLLALW